MGWIGGIDFSSHAVHIVMVDEDSGAWQASHSFDLGGGDSFDRSRAVRELMIRRSWWEDLGVIAVGIEEPFSRGYQAATTLARVQGAILACLPLPPFLVLDLAPARWKLNSLGKHVAEKIEVKRWAIEQGAPEGLAQDFYDAYCIARATRALIDESKGDHDVTGNRAA